MQGIDDNRVLCDKCGKEVKIEVWDRAIGKDRTLPAGRKKACARNGEKIKAAEGEVQNPNALRDLR